LKKVKFEKSLDLLLGQLEGSREAWSRAEAAKGLGRLRSNAAIPGLMAAATREQFWDVQASALRALGEIGTPQALVALLGMGLPKNRRVRRGLAEGLGNFKEVEARERIIELLNTDVSPYVRCEAALSLAKSWPEGAFEHLKMTMKVRSPNETLAEACLDAMGKIKDSRVKEVVMESLPYGNPTRVRIGALKAIKGRGYIMEDEVLLLRQILAKDKEYRVRLYLVNDVIRTLGDTRFTDSVKRAAEEDVDARIRRAALETYYEISSAAEVSSQISKLKAEVEDLKAENRRLGTRTA
jgi:aminopeptidase N